MGSKVTIHLEKDDVEIMIGGTKFSAFVDFEVDCEVHKGASGDWHNPPEPDVVDVLECHAKFTIETQNSDEVEFCIDHWEMFYCFWNTDDDEVREKAIEGANA